MVCQSLSGDLKYGIFRNSKIYGYLQENINSVFGFRA